MIEVLFIINLFISMYLFVNVELGMHEMEKDSNGEKFKLSHHLSALFLSFIPILNIYILYSSKTDY